MDVAEGREEEYLEDLRLLDPPCEEDERPLPPPPLEVEEAAESLLPLVLRFSWYLVL